jgi:hypothetical protein
VIGTSLIKGAEPSQNKSGYGAWVLLAYIVSAAVSRTAHSVQWRQLAEQPRIRALIPGVGFSTASRPTLGLIQTSIQWRLRFHFPGVELPGREADTPPAPSTEIKNARSYTSTPPFLFMAWLLIKHFTLTFACKSPFGGFTHWVTFVTTVICISHSVLRVLRHRFQLPLSFVSSHAFSILYLTRTSTWATIYRGAAWELQVKIIWWNACVN